MGIFSKKKKMNNTHREGMETVKKEISYKSSIESEYFLEVIGICTDKIYVIGSGEYDRRMHGSFPDSGDSVCTDYYSLNRYLISTKGNGFSDYRKAKEIFIENCENGKWKRVDLKKIVYNKDYNIEDLLEHSDRKVGDVKMIETHIDKTYVYCQEKNIEYFIIVNQEDSKKEWFGSLGGICMEFTPEFNIGEIGLGYDSFNAASKCFYSKVKNADPKTMVCFVKHDANKNKIYFLDYPQL